MKSNRFINKFLKRAKDAVGVRSFSFVDLTPVDSADQDGTYAKAISFALKNPSVKNIALTGPYGSGKSSIIRTYQKNSNYKFLNISLASFKETSLKGGKEEGLTNANLIERSILQQMLYGADANELPYSRFKRISIPERPLLKSLIIAFWFFGAVFLYNHIDDLYGLELYPWLWVGWISVFAFVASIPVVLISDIYKSSFGLSLKKFSLKNAEIEIGELSENSILNRHLDEIIYFFQETDYDVVVIEDLDRFGDPEIFVKLREINKLINDNGKARQIRFLYALKDDMFVHKNRAKFFDFIIPVVPIINSSNSLDKMQERLREHDFAKSIDAQFLRDVSLYIDDLRLIHNIFNEFVVYYERLKSDSLDVTKLLAVMIYKNVYPNDFENLHYGKGALAEICGKKIYYLQSCKRQLREEIEGLRKSLEMISNERARNIRELIDAYVGHIVMYHANHAVTGIVLNNKNISFSQLKNFEQFKPIISDNNIQLAVQHNQRISTGKSFSQIEEEINPGETFLGRKESIENNSASKKIELQQKIKQHEKEIVRIPQLKLFQLLQHGEVDLEKLVDENKITNGELIIYLVKHGYLDDNYHIYTSNFHEGRLTKNDRDYILTIRNFNQPNPNQRIDTPAEVCINMRKEDFGHKYVLNVILVDYLLESSEINSQRIELAMQYISQNFEQTEEFFSAYFVAGKHINELIRHLSWEWPGLAQAAISSKYGAEFISYILAFVDAEYVSDKMNPGNLLTDYLSEKGYIVLASDYPIPDNYGVLKKLNVRFHDLISLDKNEAVLEYVHEEGLYAITSSNVNYIVQKFSIVNNADIVHPEKANYTSILAVGSKCLNEYIEKNLLEYIEKVFLALPDNTGEAEYAIKKLINHEVVDSDLGRKIISKQECVFGDFEGIPESLLSHLLREEKVAISWKNISDYLGREDDSESVLTELLGREKIVEFLSSTKISVEELGKEDAISLFNFIYYNNEISDSDYCKLVNSIPYWYGDFPEEASEERIGYLIDQRKVYLCEETFNYVVDNDELTAMLISKNFDSYLEEKEKYAISDDVRELLLLSNISDQNKILLCLDITPSSAVKNVNLSRVIANLLLSNEVDCSEINDLVLSAAIINAQTPADSVRILMKCLSTWDEGKTMEVLAELPEPFCEISSYGKRPKLDNNETNLAFARLLEKKGFISSLNEEGDSIQINTFKSADH